MILNNDLFLKNDKKKSVKKTKIFGVLFRLSCFVGRNAHLNVREGKLNEKRNGMKKKVRKMKQKKEGRGERESLPLFPLGVNHSPGQDSTLHLTDQIERGHKKNKGGVHGFISMGLMTYCLAASFVSGLL